MPIDRKMAGTAKGSVEGVDEVQLDGLVRSNVDGTDGPRSSGHVHIIVIINYR